MFKIRLKYDLNAFQIDLDAPKSTKQTNAVLLAYEKAIPLAKANAAYDHAKATYHDSKLIENLADDLFYAYFTENKELADHKVLLDVAKKNKLDTAEVKKILDSNAYQDVVMQEEADLESRGVESVPYFLINGQQFDGVQDVSTFKTVIGAGFAMKPDEFLNF